MKDDDMKNIDKLLSELSTKKSSAQADDGSVDKILASLNKNSTANALPSDIKPAKPTTAKTPEIKAIKEPEKLVKASPSRSAFNDTDISVASLEKAFGQVKTKVQQPKAVLPTSTSNKTAELLKDEMFASTFSQKQEPTTKKEDKLKQKATKNIEPTINSSFQEVISKKSDINELSVQKLPLSGPVPRKIQAVPMHGTLKDKVLGANITAKSAIQSNEELLNSNKQKNVDEKPMSAEKKLPIYEKPPVTPLQKSSNEATPSSSSIKNDITQDIFSKFANELGINENDEKPAKAPELVELLKPEEALDTEINTPEEPTQEFPMQKKLFQRKKPAIRSDIQLPALNNMPTTIATPEKKADSVMQNQIDDAFREFFGETVAVSRDDIEKGLKGRKAGKALRKLFGTRDELTGELTGELPISENEDNDLEEETDDYNAPSDAPAVQATLLSMRSTASLRFIASALTSLLLLYLGLSARTGFLPAVPILDPANEPLMYLVANFTLLLITGLVCIGSIASGIAGLFKEATPDSLTTIGYIAGLTQSLMFLIKPSQFDADTITLFAPVAALMVCANAYGKRLQCAAICRNFETISIGYDHSAAFLLKNRELAAKVCKGLNEPDPALLVSRPTALVKGFLSQSFSQSKSASTARIMSYLLLGCSVLCGVYSYFQSSSIFIAISSFTGLAVLCSPFAATLLSALPVSLLQKTASKVGAVVPGWSAIETLGNANCVLVNAKDLFPPGTVRLHGIKTFEKERIDLAILYAASVLVEGCDTLRDIFLNVIENKTDMLYKVESLSTEPGMGFTAWIEHTRVIIGNRIMMQKHDIDIPSLDYEIKYTKGERSPIYLSVSGKLFGMFLVSYQAEKEVDEVLYGLEKSGISLVVKSNDFNITNDLVSSLYGLAPKTVKVLNAAERLALNPQTAYLPESEGVLSHLGTFSSFVGGLRAASGAATGERLAMLVQCVSIILGLLLCALLVFNKGLFGISLTAVLLYQIAWTALTLLLPLAKRY